MSGSRNSVHTCEERGIGGCAEDANAWIEPDSLPTRFAITALDLDVTKRCNLRCTYCFKSGTVYPAAEDMSFSVAACAVDWLIEASMDADHIDVYLIGGEPLLAWDMIEQLVPYGKLRASQFGKSIQFGTTTNLTLVNEDNIEFAKKWGMGWHCSIDGISKVQDSQRPGVGGYPSATIAESGAKLVLEASPDSCARSTITPLNISYLYSNVRYFEKLGFKYFAIACANEQEWDERQLEGYDAQWEKLVSYAIDVYRCGRRFGLIAIDYLVKTHVADDSIEYSCGAGRGTVLIDQNGDLWPCHRWDGADYDSGAGGQWRLGNIFGGPFNEDLHVALLQRDRKISQFESCENCELNKICAGGCPAANIVETGNIYRRSENSCRFSRIVFKHALRFHDTLLKEKNRTFMDQFYRDKKEPMNRKHSDEL